MCLPRGRLQNTVVERYGLMPMRTQIDMHGLNEQSTKEIQYMMHLHIDEGPGSDQCYSLLFSKPAWITQVFIWHIVMQHTYLV